MTFYAVIDTNVLVSSMLKSNSVPAQVISHVVSGKIIPVLHRDIFAEYVRVLPRKKFKFPISKIDEMLEDIIKRAIFVDTDNLSELNEIFQDPKDDLKHFPLKTFIVTPREMLDIINQSNESE